MYCGNGDERIDFEAVKPTFSSSSRSSCLAPDRCGTFCSGQDDRGGTAWVMTAKKKTANLQLSLTFEYNGILRYILLGYL